ncbi:FtsK/SpoIIIE domain-containing protein [Nocardioides euryhalodurans]|uniref:FHA domain-containing protein n=1 Tax=Nocardioides euryhalodurans TaxID=2518370 RepID=A0A4P7GLB1_9ACTN|nr:FtsK/SpoIIIE domain-containing protein [Nocardioides euryhalodurans]QBR92885.1 FHA domain-containing protein [Nocardioides euryhalodurans]
MRLAIELDGTRHEVETSQYAETATLGDLVEAVCGVAVDGEDTLWVDDRQHTANARLSDVLLLEGSRVARSSLELPPQVRGWAALMSGGLAAGQTVAVPAKRPLLIGRSPQADLTVDSVSASWSHARVERATEVEGSDEGDEDEPKKKKQPDDEPPPEKKTIHGLRVTDDGSTNGTYVDGVKVPEEGIFVTSEAVVVVGGTAVTLRPDLAESLAPAPGSLHNVTTAGTAPFNRPPRPGRPAEPDAVVPPVHKDPPPPNRFSMATVVAPLLLAVVMVMMMGPRMAVIALMSPVIAIGTWWEQKRRRRSDVEEEDERFAEALDGFREDLAEATTAERSRRRDQVPDPATVMRRAALPTTKLWQRRPVAGEMLRLHAGVGDVRWDAPLDTQATGNKLEDAVRDVVDDTSIPAAPVEVDLTDAGVVGIVGDREGALAVARSLVCQAGVHSGPADLTIGVFCDAGRDEAWSWTTWLPHVRHIGDGAGGQWLSAERGRSEALLRGLRDGIDSHITPTVLLVIDSDVLTEGRDAPARSLLGHGRPTGSGLGQTRETTQVSGIVIAANEEALPASCTTVVRVQPDAHGTVTRPDDLTTVDDVVLAGVDVDTARRCATDLARFDDPELVVPGAALPGLVRLPPLLGLEEMTAEAIRKSWASSTRISTPVGVGENGTYGIDLVRDGPHGLVGGTTGSGKSEFLRSLVAGLAARNDPTRLTFILIDFKGGAAFATCERLPHTIGTVSNLDEQLADRALRALEAEMRYRQRVFAAAGEGIDNLDAYLATNPAEPMPRLLLVVDEFAMLAKEYPDVLSSLVSVAAVGRTLGVHMILATQRPAGVVNEDILANTNLRVALRVQSRDDSMNVVGVPAASAIGRTQMGRAFVKLGQDDITPVQTALVTGRSESSASTLVDAHPLGFGEVVKPASRVVVDEDAPTDLDLLIDAIVGANEDAGYGPPRPVWPEPLGEHLELTPTLSPEAAASGVRSVGGVDGRIVQVGLADDPDRQRQIPVGWDLDGGNLLLMGIPGSGTSTTLASLALTLASEHAPDELDLIVLDMGSRDLAPLAELPHTAAYVGSGSASREQQVRLMKHLRAELDRRRTAPGPHRRTVVLIDGLAALRDEYDDFEGIKLLEGLYRAYADGPDVGMWCAATTSRAKSVPAAIDEVTTQKWLFRLADAYDYSSAGVPVKLAPAPVPGRCVFAETKLQTHVASPSTSLSEAVTTVGQRWPDAAPKASVVGQLPEEVTVAELGAHAQVTGEPWRIPVGIRESDLEPAVLETYEGEHVLIAGPPRSGRSTLLLAMVESLRAGAAADGVDLAVWGICGRRSPLADAGLDKCVVGDDGLAPLLASARVHRGPLVLVVDDAEQFDDSDQAIAGLITARPTDLLVIAAGRSDDLRSLYSHWTKTVRKSRTGVLLQPNVDYDGDLLGAALPRRSPVAVTVGRGYLSSAGSLEFLQAASPTPES